MALAVTLAGFGAVPPVAAGQGPAHAGQSTNPIVPGVRQEPEPPGVTSSPLTPKQKQALLKDNFKKMKSEADELSALAQSLQKDLDKSNPDILSLQVVEKAERIEKLAKRIKSAATTY